MKGSLPKRKGLAVGIILLFVGTCIIPSTAQNIEKLSLPSSRGNWLYVGGSGPGNYTKIQDAVNNASNGDTIFVYDDLSPYHENIIIHNKSISLIGENKYSTIIENKGEVIRIESKNVTISGFTLQNIYKWDVYCTGNNIVINHNRIISEDGWGIFVAGASKLKIFGNEFTCLNYSALEIYSCDSIEIYRNNFTECVCPFMMSINTRINVYENNFFSYRGYWWDNDLKYMLSPLKTKFYRNYWGHSRIIPFPIFGMVFKDMTILNFLFSLFHAYPDIFIPLPWVLLDFSPAQEPYDIGG